MYTVEKILDKRLSKNGTFLLTQAKTNTLLNGSAGPSMNPLGSPSLILPPSFKWSESSTKRSKSNKKSTLKPKPPIPPPKSLSPKNLPNSHNENYNRPLNQKNLPFQTAQKTASNHHPNLLNPQLPKLPNINLPPNRPQKRCPRKSQPYNGPKSHPMTLRRPKKTKT